MDGLCYKVWMGCVIKCGWVVLQMMLGFMFRLQSNTLMEGGTDVDQITISELLYLMDQMDISDNDFLAIYEKKQPILNILCTPCVKQSIFKRKKVKEFIGKVCDNNGTEMFKSLKQLKIDENENVEWYQMVVGILQQLIIEVMGVDSLYRKSNRKTRHRQAVNDKRININGDNENVCGFQTNFWRVLRSILKKNKYDYLYEYFKHQDVENESKNSNSIHFTSGIYRFKKNRHMSYSYHQKYKRKVGSLNLDSFKEREIEQDQQQKDEVDDKILISLNQSIIDVCLNISQEQMSESKKKKPSTMKWHLSTFIFSVITSMIEIKIDDEQETSVIQLLFKAFKNKQIRHMQQFMKNAQLNSISLSQEVQDSKAQGYSYSQKSHFYKQNTQSQQTDSFQMLYYEIKKGISHLSLSLIFYFRLEMLQLNCRQKLDLLFNRENMYNWTVLQLGDQMFKQLLEIEEQWRMAENSEQNDQLLLQKAYQQFADWDMQDCNVDDKFKVKGGYQKSISKMKQMIEVSNPIELLELLVKVQQDIDKDMKEHFQEVKEFQDKDIPKMSADQILPIYIYITSKCNNPHLLCQLRMMQSLFSQSVLNSQAGYIMVSFEVCVRHLIYLYKQKDDGLTNENMNQMQSYQNKQQVGIDKQSLISSFYQQTNSYRNSMIENIRESIRSVVNLEVNT